MPESISLAAQIIIPLALLVMGYFTGSYFESRHYQSILRRESAYSKLPLLSIKRVPAGWDVKDAELVMGSVVISVDYFKRFLAGLRALVGGRVKSYEPLLDRGRREAMLRLKESARRRRFDAVINVRLETSSLASGGSRGNQSAGIEIVAYGTGVKLSQGGV